MGFPVLLFFLFLYVQKLTGISNREGLIFLSKQTKLPLKLVLYCLAILFFTGCGVFGKDTYTDQVVVLMYHHLDPKESSSSTISPEKFELHLAMLKQEGFNVISLQQLGDFLAGNGEVPPKAVAITFDDGYQSNYQYAYPLLKEYEFPATVFVIVSRIGRSEGEIPKLSWNQIEEMHHGGISFQSHSFDGHYTVPVNPKGDEKPVLAVEIYDAGTGTKEDVAQRQQRVYQDLKTSKEILEARLGEPVEYFAAPYGWYDDITIAAAREAGFKYIFSIKAGANQRNTDPYRLYRINAGSPGISAEDLKKSIMKAVR